MRYIICQRQRLLKMIVGIMEEKVSNGKPTFHLGPVAGEPECDIYLRLLGLLDLNDRVTCHDGAYSGRLVIMATRTEASHRVKELSAHWLGCPHCQAALLEDGCHSTFSDQQPTETEATVYDLGNPEEGVTFLFHSQGCPFCTYLIDRLPFDNAPPRIAPWPAA